ncbi:reverse transcriptase domain-containing protein [Tanacetum coccineum]
MESSLPSRYNDELLASNTVSPFSSEDVDLEAIIGLDGYILGGKRAGLSLRESSVIVNRTLVQMAISTHFTDNRNIELCTATSPLELFYWLHQRVVYLPIAILVGLLGFVVEFPVIKVLAALKKAPTCLAILLWPFDVAGALLGPMLASIVLGFYATVVSYEVTLRVTAAPTCSPDFPSYVTGIPTVGIKVVPTEPVTSADNGVVSFASLVTNEVVTKKVNFRSLDSDKPINAKAEVEIPKASILDVHSRFGFSLASFSSYLLQLRLRMGSVRMVYGLFDLHLSSSRNGRQMLIYLRKSVPIWVKFLDIPIMAFTADGLSVMDTKLGNPIMLDSHTSSMGRQSWGRMDYAHALLDIRANRELKEEDMVIAILNVEDDGEVLHTARVKYEWE